MNADSPAGARAPMTNRERVQRSLAHSRPDRTPYQVDFTKAAAARMAAFDPGYESRLNNAFCWLSTRLPGGERRVAPHIWEDEFGVRWDRSIDADIGNVCNLAITPENVATYPFPDPHAAARYADFEATLAQEPDRFSMACIGFSLFERAWTLAGMEPVLSGMADNPAFVHALLDRILEHNLVRIAHACRYPIDAMLFGDDWGQQTGLMMGPRHWREFLKPRLRQMYAAVHAHGKRVIIHCCGKVDSLFPELIEIGVDLFNPFQPEVMDVVAMKRRYGGSLSFWGGISTQRTLPHGSVQDVRDEVRRLLDLVGAEGGYVAAPAHSIPGDARPENIAAMIDVLNNP